MRDQLYSFDTLVVNLKTLVKFFFLFIQSRQNSATNPELSTNATEGFFIKEVNRISITYCFSNQSRDT